MENMKMNLLQIYKKEPRVNVRLASYPLNSSPFQGTCGVHQKQDAPNAAHPWYMHQSNTGIKAVTL